MQIFRLENWRLLEDTLSRLVLRVMQMCVWEPVFERVAISIFSHLGVHRHPHAHTNSYRPG